MESTEETYNYQNWGECIRQLRTKLRVPVRTLCTDCNISTREYYDVLAGRILESAITSAC